MEQEALFRRCQQGDRQALGQLYADYRERLLAQCRGYVQDKSTAEDLLHDSFVLIMGHIAEVHDLHHVEGWMSTVVRNTCLLYRQRASRQATTSYEAVQELVGVSDPEPSMVSYSDILRAVDGLPEGYRQVFRLSVLEGLSHKQIAELLHIDPHSSSSQLFRAKTALRRLLRSVVLLLLAAALPLALYYRWLSGTVPTPTPAGPKPEGTSAVSPDATASVSSSPVPSVPESIPPMRPKPVQTEEEQPVTPQEEELTPPADSTSTEQTPHVPVAKETPLRVVAKEQTAKQPDRQWTVDLAYSGFGRADDQQLPYADKDINDAVYDSVADHRMPLTVALSVNYRLDSHWQVGTGLQYTRMKSLMQSGNSYISLQQQQAVQYLGIPLSLSWHHALTRQWDAYAAANVTCQLPLRSTLQSTYLLNGRPLEPTTTQRLHPGVQWSAGLGIGVQYNLSPSVSFFAQPTLQHYFQNNSGVETWQKAHPFTFTMPFGLRITLNK